MATGCRVRPLSRSLELCVVCLTLSLAGCGGGGMGTSATPTTPTTPAAPTNNPMPTLTSISPSSVTSGASATTITLTGINFIPTTTVTMNDAPVSSTFVNSTSLTTQVSASALQSPGTIAITITNPQPGGGSSGPKILQVQQAPTPGLTTVNLLANDLAWDPINKVIYLSLPSTDGSAGNSVQVVDPTTGNLGASAFAGSEPNQLAVSANSKYIYVGLNGASTLQRLTLPGLGTDIKIGLGSSQTSGPFIALDVQASPTADGTVAVVRGTLNLSPSEDGGVVIYDEGIARPEALCGFIQPGCSGSAQGGLYDSIQWDANATTMYAANNESTGFDFYSIMVSATGFGSVADYNGLVPGFGETIHFDAPTGYVYDDDGGVIDPAAGAIVGTFASSGLMVPDGANRTAYFIGQTQSNFGSSTYTLESYDIRHFTPTATLTINNVVGTPAHLIRWGTNGLAFTTVPNFGVPGATGAVYLYSGAFVAHGGVPSTGSQVPATNVQRSWRREQAR